MGVAIVLIYRPYALKSLRKEEEDASHIYKKQLKAQVLNMAKKKQSDRKEKVVVRVGRKKISADLLERKNLKKDFEEFLESGYKAVDAGQRSKESTLAVMDSPKDPNTPANVTIKGIK
jgi:protein involved in polysaccharide export with SLBB domain